MKMNDVHFRDKDDHRTRKVTDDLCVNLALICWKVDEN